MISILASAAMAISGTPAPVGTVTQLDLADGEAVVLRAHEALPLAEGDSLLPNDRVVLRGDGTADITAYGCSVTLDGASMATVSETLCGDTATDYGYAQLGGDTSGLVKITTTVLTVGIGAYAIYELTDDGPLDDDDDADPVSP